MLKIVNQVFLHDILPHNGPPYKVCLNMAERLRRYNADMTGHMGRWTEGQNDSSTERCRMKTSTIMLHQLILVLNVFNPVIQTEEAVLSTLHVGHFYVIHSISLMENHHLHSIQQVAFYTRHFTITVLVTWGYRKVFCCQYVKCIIHRCQSWVHTQYS